MEPTKSNYDHIKGWGIDADNENEPNYPFKHYTGDDHKRLNYERPPLQKQTVEVLHSNERPNLTATYGTSSPPSGLSGNIRRFAFRHSETSYAHWFPLVLADRVNVIEGILDDFKRGIIPNILAEKGFAAEWKYNKAAVIKKAIIISAVASFVFMLVYKNKKRK